MDGPNVGGGGGNGGGADPLYQVQSAQPLHTSLLWRLQRAWHERSTMSVWTETTTPIFATSNAFIASAYARIILGLLRDWFSVPRDEPVRVLEVGAGHGRLSFLVLRELWSQEEHWPEVTVAGGGSGKFGGVVGAGGRLVPFRILISDVVPTFAEFWGAHECLRPFREAGVLECGEFNVLGEGWGIGEHQPCPRGGWLSPGSFSAPLVVLANYLFNTLVHDLVRVEEGALKQARVAIFSPKATDANAEEAPDPALISHMRLVWSYEALASNPSYPAVSPSVNSFIPSLLAHYAATLPTGTVPIPLGGLEAMARLSSLSTGPTVFLLGDKGYNHQEEMAALRDPHLGLHGSFSFMANLHAAKLFAMHSGGFSLSTPFLEGFKCAGVVMWGRGQTPPGAPPPASTPAALTALCSGELLPGWLLAALPNLAMAWNDAMDGFGPDAFNTLQRRIVEEAKASAEGRPSLKTALATLRLACWDPDVFVKLKGSIIDGAPGASERAQHDVYRDVCRVYERYYPLRPASDVAFECGRVCMGLRRYPEAISLFLSSMRHCGEHHVTVHNCGICLFHLERFEAAAEAFAKALKLSPSYAEASHWLQRSQDKCKAKAPSTE